MAERRRPPNREREVSSRGLVLVVMCVGYFLVLLDVTIVNVALPKIGTGLGASVSGLQWVVDGYALALAGLMLGGGTIGDLRGHKLIVLGGLGVFAAASLGCGLAPTTAVLVGFRVVQGVGAALMLPGTLAVITHAFPERQEQARAIGVWAGIGANSVAAVPGERARWAGLSRQQHGSSGRGSDRDPPRSARWLDPPWAPGSCPAFTPPR